MPSRLRPRLPHARHSVRQGATTQRQAIGILCSGQGTNLQAILNATRAGTLRARVALVISDQPHAKALQCAERAGVEARFINPRDFPIRAQYEQVLIDLLKVRNVKLVCLAGFMRILSPRFVKSFRNHILNVHPALLPAFAGAHAIKDALAWGAKVTGVTVHFVDDQVDHGPIILQEAVSIRPYDTEQTLLARVHRVEHRLYPQAIRLVLEGRTRIIGRTVHISG